MLNVIPMVNSYNIEETIISFANFEIIVDQKYQKDINQFVSELTKKLNVKEEDINYKFIFLKNTKLKNTVLKIFKYFYPLPGLLMTAYILYVGDISIWTFVDITSGIPTFVNVLVLLVLSKQYFVLLKDYKARYLGIGKVDENVNLFYEDIKGEENEKYLL